MNSQRWGEIEVIAHLPDGSQPERCPLLFIHGAYTAAWCWDEYFLPWFAAQGHPSYALSLSGHGSSRERSHLDTYSIEDYVGDVREVVATLPAPPVLIGHSMGGMVAQKFLEHASAPAVVLMNSVPPHGLWSSALGLMLKKPGLLRDLNRIMAGSQPDIEALREALFHQPVGTDQLMRYYRRCQPESHRAIWDMTLFNLPAMAQLHRPPILVLGSQHDSLIPPPLVVSTARTFGVEPHLFADLGHGMMLEPGWLEVAEWIAQWLAAQDLA